MLLQHLSNIFLHPFPGKTSSFLIHYSTFPLAADNFVALRKDRGFKLQRLEQKIAPESVFFLSWRYYAFV